MTSVLNHEADVVVTGKVNGSHNVGSTRNIDSVAREVAELTRLALCSEGITALVGKEHLHHRGGVRDATFIVSIFSKYTMTVLVRKKKKMDILRLRLIPGTLQSRASSRIVVGVVARAANGHSGHQTTIDSPVERRPGLRSWPASIPRQAATRLAGATLALGRCNGRRGQSGNGNQPGLHGGVKWQVERRDSLPTKMEESFADREFKFVARGEGFMVFMGDLMATQHLGLVSKQVSRPIGDFPECV